MEFDNAFPFIFWKFCIFWFGHMCSDFSPGSSRVVRGGFFAEIAIGSVLFLLKIGLKDKPPNVTFLGKAERLLQYNPKLWNISPHIAKFPHIFIRNSANFMLIIYF
jgi:hypothetical protein